MLDIKEWSLVKLVEVADIIVSNVDKKTVINEKPVKLCNYMEVFKNRYITNNLTFMKATASEHEIRTYTIKKGDVIFTKDSETAKDIAVCAFVEEDIKDLVCGYHLVLARPKCQKIYGGYLAEAINSQFVHKQFTRVANGITRFGLVKEDINNIKLPLPPLPEQEKIANILRVWDKAIEKVNTLISLHEKFFNNLAKKLLKNCLNPQHLAWCPITLGEIFTERRETTLNEMELLSITGVKGIVKKDSLKKRDISNKDKSKYLLIYPGDIGYNTMRMWQGVCGISSLSGIVSPAYTICIPNNSAINTQFIYFLFKLPKMINEFYRYSQGLVDDTLGLKFSYFAEIKINIPTIEYQNQTANILLNYKNKILKYKNYKKALQTQKQGLMQKLLTGEWRVS